MKITLLCVGKTQEKAIVHLISNYQKRLQHYIKFELIEIPLKRKNGGTNITNQKNEEGALLLSNLSANSCLILLDDKGKSYDTLQFAGFIQKQMNSGIKNLVFAVGGAFGFSEEVYNKANGKLSLSKMTFTHQMVRLLFTEQLYRAFTVIRNEPYHHE